MWIKEKLLDPAICSQLCCKVGFERAGVMHALGYDNITSHTPDIDGFVPAPEADLVPCADCLEPLPPASATRGGFGGAGGGFQEAFHCAGVLTARRAP